ncbi:MAG TPA: TolC family protein [Lacunisphaera sp.]
MFSRRSGLMLFAFALAARAEVSPTPAMTVELTPDFVDRLMVEAREHNPAIAAAGARAEAAASAVEAVRTWEDPMFLVGLSMPAARGFKSSEEGNLIYGVEQKLPVFDRPKLARQAAAAEAGKENLTVILETAKLRRDLQLALTNLALDDSTIELTQEDLGWLETTLAAVDQRYRVGKSSQVEWLKIQTERAKAQDRLKTLQLEREHQQVEVNRLLNRDLHAAWPTVTLPAMLAPLPYSDELVNTALQADPKLKVMQQEVAQAEATSRVTREKRRPEVGIGLQGRSYTGDTGFREGMVTVNFTLPWLNADRYAKDYQRDRARVRASEHDAADYTLTIREELHHLVVELDGGRRQALLYRDELVPLTEQALASASAAWANSLGLFQDVLDARRMLVEHRRMLAEALAAQARTTAEITLRTGVADLTIFSRAEPTVQPMNMSGESK